MPDICCTHQQKRSVCHMDPDSEPSSPRYCLCIIGAVCLLCSSQTDGGEELTSLLSFSHLTRRRHDEEHVPAPGAAGGHLPGVPRGHGAPLLPLLRGPQPLRRLLQRRVQGVCSHGNTQRHISSTCENVMICWL